MELAATSEKELSAKIAAASADRQKTVARLMKEGQSEQQAKRSANLEHGTNLFSPRAK